MAHLVRRIELRQQLCVLHLRERLGDVLAIKANYVRQLLKRNLGINSRRILQVLPAPQQTHWEIAFSRAITDRSRSSGGAKFRFISRKMPLVTPECIAVGVLFPHLNGFQFQQLGMNGTDHPVQIGGGVGRQPGAIQCLEFAEIIL